MTVEHGEGEMTPDQIEISRQRRGNRRKGDAIVSRPEEAWERSDDDKAASPEEAPAVGWKLVPVEPTREMLLAGWQEGSFSTQELATHYRAMLAAAPQKEAQPEAKAAPVADGDRKMLVEILADLDLTYWNCERCGYAESTSTMDVAYMLRDYLADHPSPEAGRIEAKDAPEGYVVLYPDGRFGRMWEHPVVVTDYDERQFALYPMQKEQP